ncbi:MAG: hypothetical protein J6B39_05425 [Lachnospiraceae bacterium]|nr:hypothetical protein [Lachnospiraceae bacterium]
MNIESKIKGILSELSGEKDISNGATLQGDLALDSISLVTMLVEIEDAFGIELKESDMNPFLLNTVGNVVEMVKGYKGDADE